MRFRDLLSMDFAASLCRAQGATVLGLGLSLDGERVAKVVRAAAGAILQRTKLSVPEVERELARTIVLVGRGPIVSAGVTYNLLAQRWPRLGINLVRIQATAELDEALVAGIVSAVLRGRA